MMPCKKIQQESPHADAAGASSISSSEEPATPTSKYAPRRKDTASTIGTSSMSQQTLQLSPSSSSSTSASPMHHQEDDIHHHDRSSSDEKQPPPSNNSNDDDNKLSKKKKKPSCWSTVRSRWCTTMDRTRDWITLGVVTLAQLSARNPKRCVTLVFVTSLLLIGIGALTNLNMNVSSREQMTPKNSVSRLQRDWIDNEAQFPAQPHSMRVMVHADGQNVLSQQGIWHAYQVLETVTNVAGYDEYCAEAEALAEANEAGYSSYCGIRGVTVLWNNSLAIAQEELHSDTDVILAVNGDKYPNGGDLDVREIMGQMTVHYDTVVEAQSFMMEVLIPGTEAGGKQIAVDALRAVRDLRTEWAKNETGATQSQNATTNIVTTTPFFKVEVMLTDHSIEEEMLMAAFKDLPLVPAVFVIMAIFTCIVFSTARKQDGEGDNHACEQRILLGIGAVTTVVLSLASSYGLLWIIGIPFTNITQILPFVMFGIGLDAAFIIFGEFVRTDAAKDVVERVGDTFEEVGLSIVLTTTTTTLAFGLAYFGNIPNLQWMSLYAFPTVVFDFFYQITLFVALIVLDERRLQRKRQKKKDEQLQQTMADAGDNHLSIISEEDEEEQQQQQQLDLDADEASENETLRTNLSNGEYVEVELSPHYSSCERGEPEQAPEPEMQDHSAREQLLHIRNHHHKAGPPASLMDRCMAWYAERLLRPCVKAIVIVAFIVLTAGLTFSTAQFRQGFDIIELMPKGSYLIDFFDSVDKYASTGWLVPSAYFRDVDQSDPEVQKEMDNYVNDLVTMDTVTDQPPFFWLRHFNEFLTYDEILPLLNFNVQLDIFLSIDIFRMLYGDHIVRDPESGNITASRCVMYMDKVDVSSVLNQVKYHLDIRNITLSQPINGGVEFTQLEQPIRGGVKYSDDFTDEEVRELEQNLSFFLYEGTMFYVWEMYNLFVFELINTTLWGIVSVTLISFLFMPHWTATLFLFPIISVLCIDLIGFLQLCEVDLNAFSYFCLVMSIGLQVDFNMHILLRYYESPLQTRDGKVKDALQSMGSSVVVGGISTFLGVLPLIFSASDLMKILFYGFMGMVLLGCGHGVILMPVLLSIMGPINNPAPDTAKSLSESATTTPTMANTPSTVMSSTSHFNFDDSAAEAGREQRPSATQSRGSVNSPVAASCDESHTSATSDKADEGV